MLSNDTIDERCTEYYENGKIKSKYFLKGGLPEGYNKNYYENGKLDFEGYWHKGKKKGLFRYYDSSGHLSKIIEFLIFRDTTNSKPNQVIYFKPNGDTLVSESNYFEFYSTRDTIKLGKDRYTFNPCPMVKMNNYEISLSPTQYNRGENILRGYIANTEYPIKPDGTLDGKVSEYFFEIKFYVIE
eukprot:gene17033-20293_t